MSIDLLQGLTKPTINLLLAGQILGVGEAAARRAAKAGQIPVIKVGSQYRVPTAKLREMLGLPKQDPATAA